MKISLRLLIVMCLTALPFTSNASCLDQARLTGVNVAGAEFGSVLPGKVFKDYVYPNSTELAYIASRGANVIRLPFRWERLQREAKGPLDAAELKLIQTTVDTAKAQGLCVLLDVHNYAKYYSDSLAANSALQDAFVDLWLKIAQVFTDPEATAFDLMNEPANMPVGEWAALGKRTLAEIRAAKSTNLIFLAGGRWSGAHDWFAGATSVSNAIALADVKDPLNRTIIEVHQYADKNFSGTQTECRPAADFDPIFNNLTAWAKTNQQQLFLGEFGVPQNQTCLETLTHILDLLDPTVWKGSTYWATGSWWGTYPLAINIKPDVVSPQWQILKDHFYSKPQASSAGSSAAAQPTAPNTQLTY